MKQYDAIIIGFGKGGKTIAGKMAKLGKRVAIIEKSAQMYGGTCINEGCIPSKSLITQAEKYNYHDAIINKEDLITKLRNKNYAKLADLQNVDVIINNLEKEIEKGKIRKIYALKLGYCVYFSDEGKNIYTIYPVWMCECDYTESAKEELKKSEQIPDERKQYYYKQLVINAQTGQIEPYLIKKQELAYCPRIITWENTQ